MRAHNRWIPATLLACIVLTVPAKAITVAVIEQPGSSSIQVQAAFRSSPSTISEMRIRINSISDAGVAIHWDGCSLELPDGRSERIMHTPVPHDAIDDSQAETLVSPGTYTQQSIWPGSMSQFSFSSGRVEQAPITVPRSGGTLGLLLAWRDADGDHQGLWVWEVQRQPVDSTWLYVLGIVLVLGVVMAAVVL